ncbi:MAG: hypothetical protein U9O96_02805 [Candidatus Thermoplasmatota archaeon]|nr:hypothetical protein [Candidatus Thermoplasmatota archaeon]
MKEILKRLANDRRGISVMQDAVLFCVTVSLSGAILMPALVSDIPQKAYIEKENEEKAKEVLYQLMICTVDESAHLNAETVLSSLGADTNEGLLKPVIDGLLKREQLHRTYADLCTECVACQFKFSGHRLNVITYNFTEVLKAELESFLDEQLSNRYKYNFTVVWNPVVGFDFGGDISAGCPIPLNADIHTATAYVTMPPSLFTTGIGFSVEKFKHYILEELNIDDDFRDCKSRIITKEEFSGLLEKELLDLVNKTIWEGFDYNQDGNFNGPFEMESLVGIVIDYIFSKIQDTIENAFDEALDMASNVIAKSINEYFDVSVYDAIKVSLASISDTISVKEHIGDMLDDVKARIKEKSRDFIDEVLDNEIQAMVKGVINRFEDITDIGADILNWLFQQINFCRAKMSLSIWEV